MNRTKVFLKNTLFSALLSLVTFVLGIFVPRLYLVNYGSEINGLVSSINQLLSYFTLIQLGLSGAAVYALYKPIAAHDTKKINAVLSSSAMLYNRSGLIFSLLSVALAVVYPLLVTTALSYAEILILILALCGGRVIDFFISSKYTVFLTTAQKNYVISITSTIQLVLNAFVIFTLASPDFSIVWIKLIALFSFVIKAIIMIAYCRKTAPYLRFDTTPDTTISKKRWYVLIQEILGSVQMGAPVVLITVYLTLYDVSVYSVFNLVAGGISSVLSIFITGLPAGFGELIAKSEVTQMRTAYKQFELAYDCILAILYGVTAAMIMPFIALYTRDITDAVYYVPVYGILMTLNGLLYNIKTPNSMLIISAGMYKEVWWRNVITALIIVVGGIILTPMFGIPGVLLASILSNVYRTIDMLFFVSKNITGLPKAKTVFRMVTVLAEVTIVYFGSNLVFQIVEIDTYYDWVLYAVIFTTLALILVGGVALIFDRNDMKGLSTRLKGIIKRT